MGGLFFARHPLEVGSVVIPRIAIDVIDRVQWRWARRQESFSNQSVHRTGCDTLTDRQADVAVLVMGDRASEHVARFQIPHATLVRYLEDALEPWNRSPFFA